MKGRFRYRKPYRAKALGDGATLLQLVAESCEVSPGGRREIRAERRDPVGKRQTRFREHVRTLSFQTTSNTVILRDIQFVDADATGAIWAGGLIAGYVYDDKGKRVPVIQRGFLVGSKSASEK